MPARKKAEWQKEGKIWKDVSPKELQWEQKNRESNLESNAAMRAKLAQKGKEPLLVIPDEVTEWFDRTRVAYLFALEQKNGKSKKGTPDDAAAAFHVSYVKQKFERRGQFLWSVFHKVLEANPAGKDDVQSLSLLKKVLEKQLVRGTAGGGGDGALLPPLNVVTVGSSGGAEVAGMLWVSKSFLRSRTMTCVMLDTDSNKGWRKALPAMKELLEGAKLMPSISISLEYVNVAAELQECKGYGAQAESFDASPPGGDYDMGHTCSSPEPRGDFSSDRSMALVGNSNDLDEQNLVEKTESALVGLEGTEWKHEVKSPNAKAWNALFSEGAPQVDLVVVSYSIFESQEASRGLGWKFYEDMMLQAAPGTVFVIIDVLSRSRAYLDELYERLASLLEATRPKGLQAVTLDVDAALEISDGQLQSKLLDAGPAPAAVERVFRKLSLRVHPDKNPEDLDRAQMAFNRLKEAKDTVLRGHETIKQEDGSVLLAPLAAHTESSSTKAHGKDSGLLRFDVGPCDSIKAEVMVLVKGPLELAMRTRKDPSGKAAGEGAEAEGEGGDSGANDGSLAEGLGAGEQAALGGDGGRDTDSKGGREERDDGFIAAQSFAGSRPGKVFKAGASGLGYYPDP